MKTSPNSSVPCPCCGYRTLSARGKDEICQVCFWHDDGQDDDTAHEVRGGPNKQLSLAQARENFRGFDTGHSDWMDHVHSTRSGEI